MSTARTQNLSIIDSHATASSAHVVAMVTSVRDTMRLFSAAIKVVFDIPKLLRKKNVCLQ